jgi:hypothetical protein
MSLQNIALISNRIEVLARHSHVETISARSCFLDAKHSMLETVKL